VAAKLGSAVKPPGRYYSSNPEKCARKSPRSGARLWAADWIGSKHAISSGLGAIYSLINSRVGKARKRSSVQAEKPPWCRKGAGRFTNEIVQVIDLYPIARRYAKGRNVRYRTDRSASFVGHSGHAQYFGRIGRIGPPPGWQR
jgi:hypothetical protein